MMFRTKIIPIFSDNYIFLLVHEKDGTACVVDPGDPEPVIAYLTEHNLSLSLILNTHHHWDHVDGNKILKHRYDAKVIGFKSDSSRIPEIDHGVVEDDEIYFANTTFKVIETPGHTAGSICYYNTDANCIFVGDTLFSMGCGRLFEGSPELMWSSLQKIRNLPLDTMIYCAHEYTAHNAAFTQSIDPNNKKLGLRIKKIKELRAQNIPTIPTILSDELATNPFLRADKPPFNAHTSPQEAFKIMREQRNIF